MHTHAPCRQASPKGGRAFYLSMIDLTKGYWQIPLSPDAKEKATFATLSGMYHFTKMQIGLHGPVASFQRLMDKTLRGLQDCAVAYIDHILVFSQTWGEHLIHLLRVFVALWKAGLMA